MLLDVKEITCGECAGRIETAIHAVDASARVDVDQAASRVRVEGSITEEAVAHALAAIGYHVSRSAPHSAPGSDCCGGCS